MKSLPVLLLSLRLSMLGGIAAGILFVVSAWRAQALILDGRSAAFYLAATYAATLVALLLLPRVRKMDVARVVFGAFSLVAAAVWCLTAKPYIADAGFSNWVAGLCGVAGAILPFYVDEARRTQRQRRRASDAVERARAHNTGGRS